LYLYVYFEQKYDECGGARMKEYIHRKIIMNGTIEREEIVSYEGSNILALHVINSNRYRFVVVVGKTIEHEVIMDSNGSYKYRIEPIQMNQVPDEIFSDEKLEGPVWYLPQSYLTSSP
jgi:hypothetical protein